MLQRVSVAAQSRDLESDRDPAERWAPALQRTAEEALRCVRGTRSRLSCNDRGVCGVARSYDLLLPSTAATGAGISFWNISKGRKMMRP